MALRIPPAMGIAASAGRARVLANRFIILMDLAVTELCLKAPIKPACSQACAGQWIGGKERMERIQGSGGRAADPGLA